MLTSTFPCIFPLGKCFSRSTGNFNNEQIDHIMKQFHQIPSKDKRFLGYLADIKRQSEVIKKAKMKLTGNKESISLVNDFLNENNDMNEILKKLKNDPNSFEAKKIWRKFKNVLETIGGNIMYGALETTKCITQTFETAKRYGEGAAFITLAFDDIFNTRGIRASIETISNEEFPAIFGGKDNNPEYKSLEDLLNTIKESSFHCSDGIIDFNQGSGIKFHKSYLSRLAMENPIAYVSETKLILNHILFILFSCSP